MPLTTSKNAPAISTADVAETLHRLLPGGTLAPLGADVTIGELSVSAPFATYQIAPGASAKNLLPRGAANEWRALLIHDGTGVGWISIAKETVASIAAGAVADTAIDAIAVAEEQAGKGNYELRLLESRDLAFRAVWLHGSDDKLIPYAAGDGVELLTPYDVSTLAPLLIG